MSDLEVLAKKFKEWRGNRHHCRYPKPFWVKIQQLAKHHSIPVIANAFGINYQYLKKKLDNKIEELTFAPVQVISSPCQVKIEFIDRNSCSMTIHFQADAEQLIHMIQSLSGTVQ